MTNDRTSRGARTRARAKGQASHDDKAPAPGHLRVYSGGDDDAAATTAAPRVPSIREILAALPPVDRTALQRAFDLREPLYVEYAPGRYVGAHTDALPHLKCEEQAGAFRAGVIVKSVAPPPARAARTPRARTPKATPSKGKGTPR